MVETNLGEVTTAVDSFGWDRKSDTDLLFCLYQVAILGIIIAINSHDVR